MAVDRDNNTSPAAIVLMLIAMFSIAASDAVGKHLTQDYSVWQVLWLRSWVWLTVAVAWILCTGRLGGALKTEMPLLQGLRSLILVVEISVFMLAFRYLPLGDVTAIIATAPLVVLVFSVVFLGERVGRHRWAAVLVGLFGMILVARPGFGGFGWLTLLPICGALMWGGYQILVRLVGSQDSEATTLLWTGATLFVVTGFIAPFHWREPHDTATWGLLLLAGLLNALGHFGIIAALRRAHASAMQPFSYAQVVCAFAIGWYAFHEIPDVWTLIGVTAICAAGIYAVYRERGGMLRWQALKPRYSFPSLATRNGYLVKTKSIDSLN